MSRHVRFSSDRRYEVAFGNDHACGYYIQVFDKIDPTVETLLVDEDQASWTANKLDPANAPGIAAKYGVELTEYELLQS